MRIIQSPWGLAVSVMLAAAASACAQADLPIYTDHLVNGFQDWSWAPRNLANNSPVHSGTNSISVSASYWQALSFHQNDFNASVYDSFVFWANGGSGGGQRLQVNAQFGAGSGPSVALPTLVANSWQQFVVPLTAVGVANATNLNRLTIQLTSSGTSNPFYVDDIELTAKAAPALVHISVNTAQAVRAVDSRWFGINTAIWDSNFDTPQTISLLKEMGARLLRFPGGSLSDDYHWASNTTGTNTWKWWTSFDKFAQVATNVGAQAILTVNYGTGTPAEAAAWVRYANVTNHYGIHYWEIGNECYGTWETDTNVYPHDPYTYASRAQQYFLQMKAADPTIKIGIVVETGETSGANGYTNRPATNLITGTIVYGWTPVVLATLRSLGVTPDFAIYHRYPEYSSANSVACADSDPLLLQSTSGWTADTADLRQQITDYFGPAGTNIELVCTENNSDAGAQGRQSTSLVNGIYYADSLGQLMQTKFNAFVWWDLRNGSDSSGSFDPTLYGWRTAGDLGIVGGLTNCYPTFYAAKLMQQFARPGDTILSASSDYPLLSAYAARHADGEVSLLVINKDTATNFNAEIALNGFSPDSPATLCSYGIPQDRAAEIGSGSPDIAQTNISGIGTNFGRSFPPLSLSLFTFAPPAPRLTVLPPTSETNDTIVLQLHGQPNVPYVIEGSTNLTDWIAVMTNTLPADTLDVTNALPAGSGDQFWRAVWRP